MVRRRACAVSGRCGACHHYASAIALVVGRAFALPVGIAGRTMRPQGVLSRSHPSRRRAKRGSSECENLSGNKHLPRPLCCDSLALSAKQGLAMADEQLFEDLPEQERAQAEVRGALRVRVPERSQIGMQVAALDDLISEDHPVRSVWAFVGGLDLSALHDVIKAREGQPGHPPAAPELMVALWLWATVDGVGSARQLDRLCRDHLVYRWLCGGVSITACRPSGPPTWRFWSGFWRRASRRWCRQGWCHSTLWRRMACGYAQVPGRVRSAGTRGLMICSPRRRRGWSACVLKSRQIRRLAIVANARQSSVAPASARRGSRRRSSA